MKIQVRSILFALVVPLAACGGGRETPTVDFQVSDYVVLPKDAQPVSEPVRVIGTDLKVVDVATVMPTKFTELMAEGKKLVAAGKYGDAKEMFDAAAKLEKKNADVHIELARMYITMNEKAKAIASANKACKLAPLSSQAWNTLGRAELAAHKYDEAISSFTKAVELNDTNAFAWNNLGYTELLLKRYEDAVTHLTEATSLPDATGYMFNNLGTALEQLDQLDDARTAYEAGGKLGSVAASSSRKRLEGVDTIHVVAVQDDIDAEPVVPQVKEYELVNEGDVEDDAEFPPTDEVDEVDEHDTVEPGDNATL